MRKPIDACFSGVHDEIEGEWGGGGTKATGVCVCGKLAIIGKAIVQFPFLFLFILFYLFFFLPNDQSVRPCVSKDRLPYFSESSLASTQAVLLCHPTILHPEGSSSRIEPSPGQVRSQARQRPKKLLLSATPPIPKSPRMSPVPKWVTANPDRGRGGFRLPPMAMLADWSARMRNPGGSGLKGVALGPLTLNQ